MFYLICYKFPRLLFDFIVFNLKKEVKFVFIVNVKCEKDKL